MLAVFWGIVYNLHVGSREQFMVGFRCRFGCSQIEETAKIYKNLQVLEGYRLALGTLRGLKSCFLEARIDTRVHFYFFV